MKTGKTPSTKCFDGNATLTKPKASLKKEKVRKQSKLKRPESNHEEDYRFERKYHLNTEGVYSFEQKQQIEDSRIKQEVCKLCNGCKEYFPARLLQSHLRVCELITSRRKQVTQQKKQVSKKQRIRPESKPQKKQQPLIRKEYKPQRQEIKRELKKKANYQNRIGEPLRKQQSRNRPSVRKQTNQGSQIRKQPVRPRSNRPRQRNVEKRRESSHQRINGMFPMNFFQQINFGGMTIPNLNQMFNIGNDIANIMQNVNNLININIPRRGGIIWYENDEPDESFTQIYYDSPENYPQGLDEQQINEIPVHRYRANEHRQNSHTTNKSCAVCLSDFRSGEPVKTLQCQHRYHQECIDKWLELKGTCPVCRNDLH